MGFSRVQYATAVGADPGGGSITLTLGTSPTAGHLLVAVIGTINATIAGTPTGWSQAVTSSIYSGGDTYRVYIYYNANCSTSRPYTFTFYGGAICSGVILEYSGQNTVTAYNTQASSSGTTTPADSGSASAPANSLCLAGLINRSNFAFGTPSVGTAVAQPTDAAYGLETIAAIEYIPTSAGTVDITASTSYAWAGTLAVFNALPSPSITSLSPPSGAVGTSFNINGSGFGGYQGTYSGNVYFNGSAATVTAWGSTQITCTVPAIATGIYAVQVSTTGGTASSSFTILKSAGMQQRARFSVKVTTVARNRGLFYTRPMLVGSLLDYYKVRPVAVSRTRSAFYVRPRLVVPLLNRFKTKSVLGLIGVARALFRTKSLMPTISNRAKWQVAAKSNANSRAKFIGRLALTSKSRATFMVRPLLYALSRAKYQTRALLKSATRAVWSIKGLMGFPARSRFLGRLALAVQGRAKFLVRLLHYARTRVAYLTRVASVVSSRARFRVRSLTLVPSRARFYPRPLLSSLSRAVFKVRPVVAALARGVFQVRQLTKVAQRAKFLIRPAVAIGQRAKFYVRPMIAGLSRAKFNAKVPTTSSARAKYAIRVPVAFSSRATFLTRLLIKGATRAKFLIRLALLGSTRGTYKVRSTASFATRSKFYTRAVYGVRTRAIFFTKLYMTLASRAKFSVTEKCAVLARGAFKIAAKVVAKARATSWVRGKLVTSAPARFFVKAKYSLPQRVKFLSRLLAPIGQLSFNKTTNKLNVSFMEVGAVAAPYSSVTSKCKVTDTNNLPVFIVTSISVGILFPDGTTTTVIGPTTSTDGNYAISYTTKGAGTTKETWTITGTDTSVRTEYHNVPVQY